MPEKQYYCLDCENGESFFQFQIEHRSYETNVDEHGEEGEGDAQDDSYFTDDPTRPGVFCGECRKEVKKIVPPVDAESLELVKIDTEGVYLFDEAGEEIVCWVDDEMKEDPVGVAFAIAGAMKTLYEQGPAALKERIGFKPYV